MAASRPAAPSTAVNARPRSRPTSSVSKYRGPIETTETSGRESRTGPSPSIVSCIRPGSIVFRPEVASQHRLLAQQRERVGREERAAEPIGGTVVVCEVHRRVVPRGEAGEARAAVLPFAEQLVRRVAAIAVSVRAEHGQDPTRLREPVAASRAPAKGAGNVALHRASTADVSPGRHRPLAPPTLVFALEDCGDSTPPHPSTRAPESPARRSASKVNGFDVPQLGDPAISAPLIRLQV